MSERIPTTGLRPLRAFSVGQRVVFLPAISILHGLTGKVERVQANGSALVRVGSMPITVRPGECAEAPEGTNGKA